MLKFLKIRFILADENTTRYRGLEMAMKNNNPRAIQEAFQKEYAETNKWTRAWAEESVCNAVRFAATLSPRDPKKLKLVKSIPADRKSVV